MENKINIAELLKDCPKGMELYSPLCGKCVFDSLNMGTIICKKQNTQDITFTSEGYYMLPVFENCECMIFPSKDLRDWSKFQRPFKDGDMLATDLGSVFYLNTRLNTDEVYGCYVGIGGDGSFHICEPFAYKECCGFATEEEKQKLFDAIKAHGYEWDAETKTLRELIKVKYDEPSFKVGDIIQDTDGYKVKITKVDTDEECYEYISTIARRAGSIPFGYQDEWELVPNKFDITTLKPFDKVLVRSGNYQTWTVGMFGFYSKENNYPFACVGGYVYQCIPYEENKHLLGTTDDCDEFYKTWE